MTIETETPSVQISESSASETSDPSTGADSEGTEQTIQADPVKPETPEKPTTVADDHTGEDVPQEERNAETPPTYTKEQTTVTEPSEPEAGSTNSGGQVYVPGFGYVDNGGGNQVVEDNSIYENGNKIGSMVLFIIIMMGYAVIKVFFSNLKRGGILLIQISVGSLYMFSVPRGYMDGFVQWCKQIIGLCLTTFLQATILVAGLMVIPDHCLLGLGLMLAAGEVPRICGAFGLDTSTRANIMVVPINVR